MIHSPRKQSVSFRTNLRLARNLWGGLSNSAARHLRELTERYRLSIAAGDLQFLEGRWYVTHAGLLRIAQRHRCIGIETSPERRLCSPESNRWVFKATVYKDLRSARGFVGFGDADPSNVSTFVSGAELRIAETRAVNRALRKAYGIGLCSVEELGSSRPSQSAPEPAHKDERHNGNGSTNGQPRLRDQLSLLILQYNLDPTLVKAYAANFCGTQTLSGASRDLVESFISHLAVSAKENRDALVCKLNSYSQPQEARP
jgi:hypothetical protein